MYPGWENSRRAFKIVTDKSPGKIPLRSRSRSVGSIGTSLKKIGVDTRNRVIPLRRGIIGELF